MKVLQIVGYKNSGKTTISKEVISYLTDKGMKVGSLKNHGHGGAPVGIDSTDSEQHRKAGASIAGVLGEHIFQLAHEGEWDITDLLVLYEQLKVEFLLIEGFKHLAYPKLLLIRNKDDLPLLTSIENVVGVIKPNDIHVEGFDLPIFDIDSTELICKWVYHRYWEAT